MIQEPESTNRSVLIADDDPIVAEMALTTLTDAGYAVTLVADGLEALNQLSTNKFDAAIVDINMPGVDGLTVIGAARANGPNTSIPIVVMTGQGDAATMESAYEIGATAFLTKPIDWSQFASVISSIIGKAASGASHKPG